MAFVIPVTAGSDWHSGWSTIPLNTIVKIIEYRQSVTFGVLEIEGTMLLEGTLILEP
jgi:hypothetical protein